MELVRNGRALGLSIALAALALALLAPAAGAVTGLSAARAVTPEPAARVASAPQGMSIEFTSRTARVAGPGALIAVRCVGVAAPACVGTLTIEAPGEAPEVAFSVDRGQQRILVVPLGAARAIFDGIVTVKTRVVAQTVQAEGGAVRSARTLRFR